MADTTPYADGLWLKREGQPDVVVTASTGNRGAATAWAAARVGTRAVVWRLLLRGRRRPVQFDGCAQIGHELLDALPEPSSCPSGTARSRSAASARSPSARPRRIAVAAEAPADGLAIRVAILAALIVTRRNVDDALYHRILNSAA